MGCRAQPVRYPISRTVQQMTRETRMGQPSYTEFRILPRSRQSLVVEIASPLFSEGFLQQVILHAHLSIYPLQTTVFISHRFHLRDHRRIHSTKFRTSFVKTSTAHTMFTAQLRNRHTALRLLQNTDDLCVAKSPVLHLKSPQISCRENTTFEHR